MCCKSDAELEVEAGGEFERSQAESMEWKKESDGKGQVIHAHRGSVVPHSFKLWF